MLEFHIKSLKYNYGYYSWQLLPNVAIINSYLRIRFLLSVICFPIYRWLEASNEVDISRARSASDIFTDG